MEFELSFEQIEKSLEVFREKLNQGKMEYEVDRALRDAFDISDTASLEIKREKIGRRKLEEIDNILKDHAKDFIDINAPYLIGSSRGFEKDVSNDDISCGVRVLRTYQTLKKYNNQIENFRKLTKLEKIF